VHDRAHVENLERTIRSGARVLDDGDTTVSADSWDAALTAVGASLAAADRVARGQWRNAFVAVRPPGHHAERDRAMGFCLLNNVAITARYLQHRHGIERVAIVDWDVHHGNGTQHAFEADPSVLFVSLHQHPLYPGTGAAAERGVGAGEGTTLNLPLASGAGDAEYLAAFEQRVLPALEAFEPGFVLVSAGFDAHRDDPLSGQRVSADGFRRMSRLLVDHAEAHAGGRLVSLLEGGYDLNALAESVEAHIGELRA
jgi:acetoin utilization deacetylase AcuC-like enzyme